MSAPLPVDDADTLGAFVVGYDEREGMAVDAVEVGAYVSTAGSQPAGASGHATAMGQSLLFCVAVLTIGLVAAIGFARTRD